MPKYGVLTKEKGRDRTWVQYPGRNWRGRGRGDD